jgi:6-phosphogluconolactonase
MSEGLRVLRVPDLLSLAEQAARWIADAAREAVARQGHCSIALSGGQTPRIVYQRLASPEQIPTVPWSALSVYFGDERCVSPQHPASNYRMVRESLFSVAPLHASQVHRMRGEDPDPNRAAGDYDQELPDALDILLLGVGADGHTASLFPGSSALNERGRKVVHSTAQVAPVDRLTITPRAIQAARAILVMAAGRDKADAIAHALLGPFSIVDVPAQLARGGTWILDDAAASRLSGDA